MAPRIRVHLPGTSRAQGELFIAGDAANHLTRVLRVTVHDRLVVFDGEGYECDVTVGEAIRGKTPNVRVVTTSGWRDGVTAHPLGIHLVQSMTKPEKIEQVLRAATELGIREFSLVHAERSQRRKSGEKNEASSDRWLHRLESIAISAAEQCGRADVVQIHASAELQVWLNAVATSGSLKLVASEKVSTSRSLSSVLSPDAQGCTVLVGPEGGLTDSEEKSAEIAGFLRFSLGPRILRTETAGPAVVAQLAALSETSTGQTRK